jgi:DNA uptake protein ComE-like DNA-binding protein
MKNFSIRKLAVAAVVLSIVVLCVALINSRPVINTENENRLFTELVAVDGIGEQLAAEIIRQRPYLSWDDLKERVDGVGDKRLGSLKAKFNLTE